MLRYLPAEWLRALLRLAAERAADASRLATTFSKRGRPPQRRLPRGRGRLLVAAERRSAPAPVVTTP